MIIETRLLNWPNFLLVAFTMVLLSIVAHLAARGLSSTEGMN